MTVTNTVEKLLPKSGEEVDVQIKVSGSDGETVRVDIDAPSGSKISERSKAEYESHSWVGGTKFWHDRLADAVDEIDVNSQTSSSQSGNVFLRTCYVKVDYYETGDIDGIIEQLLRTLDTALMEEAQKKAALEKGTEAAQEQVCEDMQARIEGIELN